jgi:hypothetical protein
MVRNLSVASSISGGITRAFHHPPVLDQHRYVTGTGGVEPNGSITPDKKWVIFTGQFDGDRSARHVYAVEIAKAKK